MGFLHLIKSITDHLKAQLDDNTQRNMELTAHYSSKA